MFIAFLNVILKLYFGTAIFLLRTPAQFYKVSLLNNVFQLNEPILYKNMPIVSSETQLY